MGSVPSDSVFGAPRQQAPLRRGTQEGDTWVMWHPQERAPLSERMETTNNAKLPEKHLLGVHLLHSFKQLSIQPHSNSPKETFRIISSLLRTFVAPGGSWHPLSALNHSSGAVFQAWLFPLAK